MDKLTMRSANAEFRHNQESALERLEMTKQLFLKYYVEQKLSCEEACQKIKENHNIEVSLHSGLQFIKLFGIQRTKAEAASVGNRTLDDYTIITWDLRQVIDGMLFGDGSMVANRDVKTARLSIGSMHQEFAQYCSDILKSYDPSGPHYNSGSKGVGMWGVQTKVHPDLFDMYMRWYPEGPKIIPPDIEFTPAMVLLWYLGDGCLSSPLNGNARYMYFATNCFSRESLERIVVPKFAEIGIEVCRITDDCRVFIQTNSIPKLLKYMGGKSPVRCFDYKFDIEEWRTHVPMHEAAVKANIDYSRLANWVKHGLIAHERSPGGKKVVFTPEQYDLLVKRLDSGELPREKGKKRKSSQEILSQAT